MQTNQNQKPKQEKEQQKAHTQRPVPPHTLAALFICISGWRISSTIQMVPKMCLPPQTATCCGFPLLLLQKCLLGILQLLLIYHYIMSSTTEM